MNPETSLRASPRVLARGELRPPGAPPVSWCAVDKPTGWVVHPGWARGERTLMHWLRDELELRVHPIHRLDRGSSGVVLFGLDPTSAASLSEALNGGGAIKEYRALVRGRFEFEGRLDHPLAKGESKRGPRVDASTLFRPLGTASVPEFGHVSWVAARPLTGRLHQIRRHLKHLSHPIVGDVRYGKGALNRLFRDGWGLHRLALHARSLSLPDVGAWHAPVPDELAQTLRALGMELRPEDVAPASIQPGSAI